MTTFKVVIFMLGLIALSKNFTTSVGVKLHLFHVYCCTTYCCQLWVNFNKSSYLKARVAYNNMRRQILGYSRWDSASSMFANNAIDTFDALLRKNIYGLKKLIFNIKIDLIRVMYNCFEIVNGPIWVTCPSKSVR